MIRAGHVSHLLLTIVGRIQWTGISANWASTPRQIIFVRESTVSDRVAAAVSLSMHHPKK
jgi:hypothetical protein